MPPMYARYYCSVPTCKKDPSHSSFRLPKDPFLAKSWINQLNMDENYLKKSRNIYVCEAHFDNNSISQTKSEHRRLATGTIPTLNLPTKESYQTNSNFDRAQRLKSFSSSSRNKSEADFAKEMRKESVVAPQENMYSDLVENIIVNSLKYSPCQNYISPEMEQKAAMATSMPSTSRGKDQENYNNFIKRKKRMINPMLQVYQVCLKYPDYTPKTILELQKQTEVLSNIPEALERLTLKMYLMYPQTYKMLHSCLQLPTVSVNKGVFDGCSLLTEDGVLFAETLQMKVSNMSEKQKHCVICLGEIQVKENLYYDITFDKLLGISDINDIQKPEPARKALVLTVQGIFSDWKQPIAIAYVGSSKFADFSNIKEWINRNICNLLKIGYKVRAYVSDTNYLSIIARYQIEQESHKIFCIYDVSSLFRLFYYNLSNYDYSFTGGVARMHHILDYYKLDRIKLLRLTPKLTEKHVKFSSCDDLNLEQVKDVFNLQTAASMSACIDFGTLHPSVKSTVQFIKDMSTLLEVLHSNNCDESIKVESGKTHVEFLRYMLLFFNNFKPIHSSLKTELPKAGTFVEQMQMTIKSVLLLYEDIKLNNDSKTFPTRRLSLDYLRSFFDKVKTNSNGPTCRKINSYFKESTIINVLKLTNKTNFQEIEKSLDQAMQLISDFNKQPQKIVDAKVSPDMRINKSEYQRLDLRKKDAVILLAGFILKKCQDRHADCVAMKNYIGIVLHDTSSICKPILDDIQKGICVVPQENFIEFIEMLEIRFRSFMTKAVLDTVNGKLIKSLLVAMQIVCFPMPCPCFPILYAKKLYLRIRLCNMLKYNNSMSSGMCESGLVVNDL